MADTLRDNVKKAQMQKEEEQREANPYQAAVSPAAVQTSNPDVAKMAGTPAQKDAALEQAATVETIQQEQPAGATAIEQSQQMAAAQSSELMEAKTAQQYQTDATAEKAKAWSETMKGFGSLGGRVESLIQAQMTGPADGQPVTGPAFEIDEGLVSSLAAPGQEEAVTQALQSFQSAATPEEAFQVLADNSAAFSNPDSAVEFIKQAYKNDPAAQSQMIAEAIANNVINADEMTMDALVQGGMLSIDESGNIAELGMSEAQVEEILGENWNQLTIAQIDEKLNEFQQESVGKADKIREQLADPTLDPAARAALVDELRRLGSTGELQAEQLAQQAVDIAQDTGKMVFNGKVEDIEDLLADERIQDEVKNFLAGGEGAEQWREDNPDFAAWIDREMADLKGRGDELDERMDQFSDIQESNEKLVDENLADEAGGKTLSEDVMSALGFSKEGFQAGAFDPTTSALYSALQDLESNETTGTAIEALNKLSPEQMEDLKGEFLTSPEGAESLVNILSNPKHSASLIKTLEINDKLDSAGSVEDVTEAVTGMSPADVQDTLRKLRLNALLGDKASSAQFNMMKELFGTDGNGNMNADPAKVAASVKAFLKNSGGDSLESIVQGGDLGKLTSAFDSGKPRKYAGKQGELHSKLATYFDDGKISPSELSRLRNSFGSDRAGALATLQQFRNNPAMLKSLGISPKALSSQITEAARANLDEVVMKNNPYNETLIADMMRTPSVAQTTFGIKAEADKFSEQLRTLRDRVDSKSITPEERALIQSRLKKMNGLWDKYVVQPATARYEAKMKKLGNVGSGISITI